MRLARENRQKTKAGKEGGEKTRKSCLAGTDWLSTKPSIRSLTVATQLPCRTSKEGIETEAFS